MTAESSTGGVVDVHCYFWQVARGDCGWLERGGSALHSIRQDYFPNDYPDQAVAQLVVVQAVPTQTIDALAACGLRFDALIAERHLPMMKSFCARHPELAIVIDHAAKPNVETLDSWKVGIAELAKFPHVCCKVLGLLTEFSSEALKEQMVGLSAVFTHLFEAFGAERLMWGSDWPVLTLAAPYDDWPTLNQQQLLSSLSPVKIASLMGGTARKFYVLAG